MLNRLYECWFEFCGINCENDQICLQLSELPTRELPVRRGERVTVPGRSGYLFVPEGEDVYEEIGIVCNCITLEGYKFSRIDPWLNRTGFLRFSDEPERAYKARLLDQPSRHSIFPKFDGQQISLVFTAQPWRYIYPEPEAQPASNGGRFLNGGDAKSAPRITISGSGSMSVTIAGQPMSFSGVPSGGIIVDSDAMDCFLPNGALANQYASFDKFPLLNPGYNTISWSGGATGVTILPRSRDI